MTTRSMITVNTEQGINAIYCHWDGYLEHNGVILKKFYSTKESLKELFRNYDKKEQGYISSISMQNEVDFSAENGFDYIRIHGTYKELIKKMPSDIEFVYLVTINGDEVKWQYADYSDYFKEIRDYEVEFDKLTFTYDMGGYYNEVVANGFSDLNKAIECLETLHLDVSLDERYKVFSFYHKFFRNALESHDLSDLDGNEREFLESVAKCEHNQDIFIGYIDFVVSR